MPSRMQWIMWMLNQDLLNFMFYFIIYLIIIHSYLLLCNMLLNVSPHFT